ncbi:MAG TPA: hypothetical protein ENJ82_09090, partial [Bacteroidetes bacterium]|nr:hypothetical protein [Bacteroidota bacterium]
MAEINQNEGKANKQIGRPRQSKKSTRTDMTAMVDDTGTFVLQDKLLTLSFGKGDRVYYYHGLPESQISRTVGLREVVRKHL